MRAGRLEANRAESNRVGGRPFGGKPADWTELPGQSGVEEAGAPGMAAIQEARRHLGRKLRDALRPDRVKTLDRRSGRELHIEPITRPSA